MKKFIPILGISIFITTNWLIKILEFYIFRIFDLEIAAILMFLTSFFSRYLIILAYDKIKIDWLLIEHLKEKIFKKQEDRENTYITKKIIKWRKKGDKYLRISLILSDPTLAAIYFRIGHHLWNNIPREAMKPFLTSVIFCTSTLLGLFYFFEGSITSLFVWLWQQVIWLLNLIF